MSRGYEVQDLKPRVVAWAAVIFAVLAVLVHTVVWFLFQDLRTSYEARDVRRTQVEAPAASPPEPRLEVNAFANWEDYSRAQKAELNAYGWASRDEGKVRIPIERAMELMVQQEKQQ